MFTVGILVGKGLAQARYEGTLAAKADIGSPTVAQNTPPVVDESAGRSLTTTGQELASPTTLPPVKEAAKEAPKENPKVAIVDSPVKEPAPLHLAPQKDRDDDGMGSSLLEPTGKKATEEILKNPRIRSLVEDEGPNRGPASKPPPSFAKGRY